MKGQVTLEELLSLAIYLALLSLLLSAVFSFRVQGEEWADSVSLRAEAFNRARAYDSFSNSNIPYPDRWEGGGAGYIEVPSGAGTWQGGAGGTPGLEGETVALPVLRGIVDDAEGEPI